MPGCPLRRTSTRPPEGAGRSKAAGELTLGLLSGENQKLHADLLYVGASLLAMDVNENAHCLEKCVAFKFVASRLAPTGECVFSVGAAEGCDLLILMLL